MKLKDYKNDYYEFSGKLSDNTRKLAFAGIAIVWIFKQEKEGTFILPDMLKLAVLMFVITLSFDLLQYIEDSELTASRYFNWPANFFFWSKVIALVIGYVFILKFLL
jgi:hypothetical protein